jgi:hypothetical protein
MKKNPHIVISVAMVTVKKGPVAKFKNKWYTSIIFHKLFHLLKIRPTLRV